MKRIITIATLSLLILSGYAQDENNFGIKFSGFVKNDFFIDTRQTVAAREGHFLLWPSAELPDDNGDDINANPSFNMLAVQSRLKGTITGPDAFGAKTSGVIEADFFAQANDNINLLRLRHAFVKLNWTRIELLAGQYWNPLFVTDCYPGTVSFNTGTPLQSFSRNPQLRVSYMTGGIKLTAAALSQRDYTSRGEAGVSSSYLRNSAIPDMHLQVQYTTFGEDGANTLMLGGGIAYKTIVPRLQATGGFPLYGTYKVDEKVGGLTLIGFTKIKIKPVIFKLEARYGENICDVLAPGGFAVTDIVDVLTGQADYTPLRSMTLWGEIHTEGDIQFGIFGGFFKNLGTKENILDPVDDVYGLGTDINSLARISPRIIFNSGKTRIALEMEYTMASYGSDFDVSYIPASTVTVTNIRGLLAVYYFF